MKKLLSLILLLFMVISIMPVSVFAYSYKDMPDADHWSFNSLVKAIENKILCGYTDGYIYPGKYITRAELATIINRIFGSSEKASLSVYSDVKSNSWYYSDIAKAVAMGTLKGTGKNTISPAAYITRQDAFIMLARALVLKPEDKSVLDSFTDNKAVSDYAKTTLAAMVKAGYVSGSNNKLNPKANITREEVASIIDKIFNTHIKSSEKEITGTYEGNVIISVSSVVLKNATISGDLIIGDGVGNGEITLDNVSVKGRVVIRGGGDHSIKILNKSGLGNVIVAKSSTGAVRVYCEDGAKVDLLQIEDGKDDVLIEGSFNNVEVNYDTEVILTNVDIASLSVNSEKSTVDIRSGKIATVSVNTSANLSIEKGTSVGELNLTTDSKVDIKGSVNVAKVDGKQVSVSSLSGNTSSGGSGSSYVKPGLYLVKTYDQLYNALNDSNCTEIEITGSFSITEDVYMFKPVTIDSGVTFDLGDTYYVTLSSTLVNYGTIVGEEYITIKEAGVLTNNGNMDVYVYCLDGPGTINGTKNVNAVLNDTHDIYNENGEYVSNGYFDMYYVGDNVTKYGYHNKALIIGQKGYEAFLEVAEDYYDIRFITTDAVNKDINITKDFDFTSDEDDTYGSEITIGEGVNLILSSNTTLKVDYLYVDGSTLTVESGSFIETWSISVVSGNVVSNGNISTDNVYNYKKEDVYYSDGTSKNYGESVITGDITVQENTHEYSTSDAICYGQGGFEAYLNASEKSYDNVTIKPDKSFTTINIDNKVINKPNTCFEISHGACVNMTDSAFDSMCIYVIGELNLDKSSSLSTDEFYVGTYARINNKGNIEYEIINSSSITEQYDTIVHKAYPTSIVSGLDYSVYYSAYIYGQDGIDNYVNNKNRDYTSLYILPNDYDEEIDIKGNIEVTENINLYYGAFTLKSGLTIKANNVYVQGKTIISENSNIICNGSLYGEGDLENHGTITTSELYYEYGTLDNYGSVRVLNYGRMENYYTDYPVVINCREGSNTRFEGDLYIYPLVTFNIYASESSTTGFGVYKAYLNSVYEEGTEKAPVINLHESGYTKEDLFPNSTFIDIYSTDTDIVKYYVNKDNNNYYRTYFNEDIELNKDITITKEDVYFTNLKIPEGITLTINTWSSSDTLDLQGKIDSDGSNGFAFKKITIGNNSSLGSDTTLYYDEVYEYGYRPSELDDLIDQINESHLKGKIKIRLYPIVYTKEDLLDALDDEYSYWFINAYTDITLEDEEILDLVKPVRFHYIVTAKEGSTIKVEDWADFYGNTSTLSGTVILATDSNLTVWEYTTIINEGNIIFNPDASLHIKGILNNYSDITNDGWIQIYPDGYFHIFEGTLTNNGNIYNYGTLKINTSTQYVENGSLIGNEIEVTN